MLMLGFPIEKVVCIENPSFEGWRLLYSINDNIGVFKSSWGEVKRFNKNEIYKLIKENDREWQKYWE